MATFLSQLAGYSFCHRDRSNSSAKNWRAEIARLHALDHGESFITSMMSSIVAPAIKAALSCGARRVLGARAQIV